MSSEREVSGGGGLQRILSFVWFSLVMALTSWMPDVRPILRLRGILVRPCFAKCGRNLLVARDVTIAYSTRMEIGDDVWIAKGAWISSFGGVTLGDETMLGPYVVMVTANHRKRDGSYRFAEPEVAPIRTGRGVWIGAHSTLTPGVVLGDGVAVAAGALVTGNAPADTLVTGVPARPLRAASQEK